jgi:chorismate synthase
MNIFGNKFRIAIYGESHGSGVGIVIDGVPAGINLDVKEFMEDISRRKAGKQDTTSRIEEDIPKLLSGIYNGFTTGAPINIFFENKNINSKDYTQFKSHPRPGHSDYAANIKYDGYNDIRGGGHFSGRLTLGIVAAGVIAKKIILRKMMKIEINSKVIQVGESNEADSYGGVVEAKIKGLPAGIGEPFFDSIESQFAHIIFAIPGIKGIEFGAGFEGCINLNGSEFNDLILDKNGRTLTNNNAGINGGISNGNEIYFRVAVKPTASIEKIQKTYNFETNKMESLEIKGRHDKAFIWRVPVIIEAAIAIVLANFIM